MTKDPSIVHFLKRLNLEERGWTTVDHWDSDLMAIGVTRAEEPRRLVYVSTFDKPDGRFYFECESPVGEDDAEFEVGESSEDASFDEVLSAIERHLKLQNEA